MNYHTISDSSPSFELSFRYRFESAHRFTRSCADSCATPHGHTWFAEALFAAPADELGDDDMVMEFSRLKTSFKRFITETVDHSFMHHFEDPILPALREFIPSFRGLPFPGDPTTELIAALFFCKLQSMHVDLKKRDPQAFWPEPSEMLIQETPTNGIRFKRPFGGNADDLNSNLRSNEKAQPGPSPSGRFLSKISKINQQFEGWWQDPNPDARHLKSRS